MMSTSFRVQNSNCITHPVIISNIQKNLALEFHIDIPQKNENAVQMKENL